MKFFPRRYWLFHAFLILPLAAFLAHGARLQPSDLVYQGAFKVPSGVYGPAKSGTTNIETFAYTNGRLAYDPASNTLYLPGHSYGQLIAAISIPTAVNSTALADLPRAQLVQPFRNITEGTGLNMGFGTGLFQVLGMLAEGQRLYWSAGDYYQVSGVNSASQGYSNLLSNPDNGAQGPWFLSGEHIQRVAGPITLASQAWADKFTSGRTILSGRFSAQGVATTSNGPTLYAYSVPSPPPAKGSSLGVTPVMFWPAGDAYPTHTSCDEYNGVIFIDRGDKQGVLFVGRKSQNCRYLQPPFPDPQSQYCDGYSGYHGEPYSSQMWLFDVDELGQAAVNKTPQAPRHYAAWAPAETAAWPTCPARLAGAAYDAANGLLYVSHTEVEKGSSIGVLPIIHVWKVSGSPTPPPPPLPPATPQNLRVK